MQTLATVKPTLRLFVTVLVGLVMGYLIYKGWPANVADFVLAVVLGVLRLMLLQSEGV